MADKKIMRRGRIYEGAATWRYDLPDGEWLELVRFSGRMDPGWHLTRMPGCWPRNEWVSDTLSEAIDTCLERGLTTERG